jgi:hypothetical protein
LQLKCGKNLINFSFDYNVNLNDLNIDNTKVNKAAYYDAYKGQAITTPICNAGSVGTWKFNAPTNTAKFFNLAFTTKFKNKIKKFGFVGTLIRIVH